MLKGIEWPDQLSMKLTKTRELQVNLPLRKEVGFTIFIYLKTLVSAFSFDFAAFRS